jgi:predicted nucleic acid-binding protein
VGAVRLLTNNYVLAEARSVLRKPEFSLTDGEKEGLTRYLHMCVTVAEDPPEEEILSNLSLLRDKKDIPVALGAKSSCSDYLVTGDKELLEAAGIPSIKTSDLIQLIVSNQQSKASANYTSKEE